MAVLSRLSKEGRLERLDEEVGRRTGAMGMTRPSEAIPFDLLTDSDPLTVGTRSTMHPRHQQLCAQILQSFAFLSRLSPLH